MWFDGQNLEVWAEGTLQTLLPTRRPRPSVLHSQRMLKMCYLSSTDLLSSVASDPLRHNKSRHCIVSIFSRRQSGVGARSTHLRRGVASKNHHTQFPACKYSLLVLYRSRRRVPTRRKHHPHLACSCGSQHIVYMWLWPRCSHKPAFACSQDISDCPSSLLLSFTSNEGPCINHQ